MNFLRQLDILNPSDILFPVTIIGAGGIGRHLAETLAEMGCRDIRIYDHDLVEEHNRPNQAYRKKDIGKLKVEACKEIIGEFAEWCSVTVYPERFEGQRPLEGIVISAVDHMEIDKDGVWGRKEIWQKVREQCLNVPLYIDGRIGGEALHLFTIKPFQLEDVEAYEKRLFSDKEAVPLPCTAQNIIYVGKIIGGLIANQLKKWIKWEKYSREILFDLVTMTLIIDGRMASP